MKKCPECFRDYTDDTLIFCLDDGSRLLDGPRTSEHITVVLPEFHSEAPTQQFNQLPTEDRLNVRQTAPSVRLGKSRVLIISAVVGIILVVGAFFGYRYLIAKPSQQIESVAVLPFINESGSVEIDYLSEGLTETLINRFSRLPDLKVIARSSVFRYKGREADPQKIAKDLDVRSIVSGRVSQRGESLSISVELTDASNNTQIWGERFVRKSSDLLAVQDEISQLVGEALRIKLTGDQQSQLTKRHTQNEEAYKLYLQGRYQWNRRTAESLQKAVEFYRQAIERDAAYALAHSGLAEAYVLYPSYGIAPVSEMMPRAKAAAIRSIEIDETIAEAHAAIGLFEGTYTRNKAAAEKAMRRAIELNPNYATAHQWLALMLTVWGRFDEGIAESKKAEILDPLSPVIGTDHGTSLIFARRYDEAITQLKRVAAREPDFPYALVTIGQAYHLKGSHDEAIASYRRALELENSTTTRALLAATLAKAGLRDEASLILKDLTSEASQKYVSSYHLAIAYACLGNKDEAFSYLERDLAESSFNPPGYATDPKLDELRGDPRLDELIKKASAGS